jgi:hypothetical protein
MDIATKTTSSLLMASTSNKFADTKLILFYTILSIILTFSLKNEYLKTKLNYLINNKIIRSNGSKRAKLKRLTNFAKTFLASHTIKTVYGIQKLNKNFMETKYYKKYLSLPTQFNNKLKKYSYGRLFYTSKSKYNKAVKSSDNEDYPMGYMHSLGKKNSAKKPSRIYNSRVFYFELSLI